MRCPRKKFYTTACMNSRGPHRIRDGDILFGILDAGAWKVDTPGRAPGRCIGSMFTSTKDSSALSASLVLMGPVC